MCAVSSRKELEARTEESSCHSYMIFCVGWDTVIVCRFRHVPNILDRAIFHYKTQKGTIKAIGNISARYEDSVRDIF